MVKNINNKLILIVTFFTLIIIGCKVDHKKGKNTPMTHDLEISVYNITEEDKKELGDSKCPRLPTSLYRKINLTNNTRYDTLWIAVADYCENQKPFLLYDLVSYFNNDTLVSRDFVNTSSGYEIPLMNKDSISLYLRLMHEQYKQDIKFESRTNVAGNIVFEKYVFTVDKFDGD